MARADVNRDRLLKLTAENCGRRVEEAKIRARKVKKERDEVARLASLDILERLESAERRREELLSARGRRSPSRISRTEAAIRIQRIWRKQRLQKAVNEFQSQRISLESVTKHAFEQVVGKFKVPATIRAATRLLIVLGLVNPEIGQKEIDGLVRTFLSAFMILGHTTEVLHSHDQSLEMVPNYRRGSNIFQDLIAKAREFVTALEHHNRTFASAAGLSELWTTYLTAFQAWKVHDASVLVEMLVGKFVDLDLMLLDIQKSPTMHAVVEEYTQGIKSGQMLLLSKIRRLVGDETRNVVRIAVQAGRRRHALAQRAQTLPITEDPTPEEQVQMEILEPPSFGGQGLSNRQIMHELALNPEYELVPPSKSDDQRSREELFKNTFYASLLLSLREGDQSLLPTLVKDIKSRILSLLQPSSPSYTTFSEHLDETIVQQECQRGLFDMQKFLNYILHAMRQLCAPIRDGDVASISTINGVDDLDTFVMRIRKVAEVLALMALDSANFHLRVARPALLEQAQQYERTKFSEDIKRGTGTLTRTTQWLEEPAAKLREERASSNTPPPSSIDIWRHAYTDLLFSDADIPETFSLDIDRIQHLRSQLNDIILLAAILLVSKTFSAGSTARQITWTTLSSRLKVLQSESAENIVAEIDQFISSPQLKREILVSVIRRIKTGNDPCVVLLQRRMKSLIINALAGAEVAVAGMGFGEMEGEVREVLGAVGKVGRVNWACYREWYDGIVGSYLERS